MNAIDTSGPTPAQAWADLCAGNQRFVAGHNRHPRQSSDDRARLVQGQRPKAVVFGCSTRVSPPKSSSTRVWGSVRSQNRWTRGRCVGSLFTESMRSTSSMPLIAVLGHDSCGAVKASVDAVDDLVIPGGYVRDIVERVTPSILAGRRAGLRRIDEFEARHVQETAQLIMAQAE